MNISSGAATSSHGATAPEGSGRSSASDKPAAGSSMEKVLMYHLREAWVQS